MVTATGTAPAACDGVTTLIDMLLVTLTLEPAMPPKVTPAPLTKFVPLIVTAVPPEVEPEFGETDVTVGAGAGAVYVKPPVNVPLCPSEFETTTLTLPEECAGVNAVIEVALTTFTLVAAAPPIVTTAPEEKFVPVIETDVPPDVLPLPGEIDVTVGAPFAPPPDFGKIVVSFLSAPGEALR